MKLLRQTTAFFLVFLEFTALTLTAQERARDLGIPSDGTPGSHNAITDVPGVTVGYSTIIEDGERTVRTGVSAIFPRGKEGMDSPVTADWYTLNGNGEMTGTTWVRDSGLLEGPIMVTNTHSVGTVHQATIRWAIENKVTIPSLPVVAETWDGFLNDINGLHVKQSHAYEALNNAKSGPIIEGSIGSGTGMICYQFKGGIGTASRIIEIADKEYTVGVWVQANHGLRNELLIKGKEIGKLFKCSHDWKKDAGSIIIILATDAPLLQHQLNRVARRASLGLARTGSIAHNSSGDVFIAFSTANNAKPSKDGLLSLKAVPNESIDPVFTATVQATEEAIINALVAGNDMHGVQDFLVPGLPNAEIKQIFKSVIKK